jgi:lysyl-tRNA synthetase class 2
MKRLLAAGVGDSYQICRVFRDGELGRWHQPEFSLLEWYRVGFDEHALMDEVEALLLRLIPERLPAGSRRVAYAETFRERLGLGPESQAEQLSQVLSDHGIPQPVDTSRRGLVDLAFATVVVPALDPHALTFVTDFPADQAALAELKVGDPPRAARFEAFCGGLELANGFAELRDAAEQRRRFEQDLRERARLGLAAPPLDECFLAALESGLPICAGVAVGFDRVVALATGARELGEVLSLAHRVEPEPYRR